MGPTLWASVGIRARAREPGAPQVLDPCVCVCVCARMCNYRCLMDYAEDNKVQSEIHQSWVVTRGRERWEQEGTEGCACGGEGRGEASPGQI